MPASVSDGTAMAKAWGSAKLNCSVVGPGSGASIGFPRIRCCASVALVRDVPMPARRLLHSSASPHALPSSAPCEVDKDVEAVAGGATISLGKDGDGRGIKLACTRAHTHTFLPALYKEMHQIRPRRPEVLRTQHKITMEDVHTRRREAGKEDRSRRYTTSQQQQNQQQKRKRKHQIRICDGCGSMTSQANVRRKQTTKKKVKGGGGREGGERHNTCAHA